MSYDYLKIFIKIIRIYTKISFQKYAPIIGILKAFIYILKDFVVKQHIINQKKIFHHFKDLFSSHVQQKILYQNVLEDTILNKLK